MDRRRFVKMSMSAAAAGAAAGTTAGLGRALVEPRPPRGAPVPYYGAHRVDGPAPRGVPFIPVRVTDAGAFEGRPVIPSPDGDATLSVLDWYRYCDHGRAPGLDPERDADDTLRYFVVDDPTRTVRPWFDPKRGEPVRPVDFPDVEFGASFAWRSVGAEGRDVLTGVLVRYPLDALARVTRPKPPARALDDAEWAFLMEHVFAQAGDSVFIAVSSFCTHFCCTPGYKHTDAAKPKNAWAQVFCACHGSVFEPREPVRYAYAPETG